MVGPLILAGLCAVFLLIEGSSSETLYPVNLDGSVDTSQQGVKASHGIAIYVAWLGVAFMGVGARVCRGQRPKRRRRGWTALRRSDKDQMLQLLTRTAGTYQREQLRVRRVRPEAATQTGVVRPRRLSTVAAMALEWHKTAPDLLYEARGDSGRRYVALIRRPDLDARLVCRHRVRGGTGSRTPVSADPRRSSASGAGLGDRTLLRLVTRRLRQMSLHGAGPAGAVVDRLPVWGHRCPACGTKWRPVDHLVARSAVPDDMAALVAGAHGVLPQVSLGRTRQPL